MAKKKKKKYDEDDELLEQEEQDYEPPPRTTPTAKPRNDAYVAMLMITFLAMVAGCVLLYLDIQQYEGKSPPQAPAPALPELGKAGPAAK